MFIRSSLCIIINTYITVLSYEALVHVVFTLQVKLAPSLNRDEVHIGISNHRIMMGLPVFQ